MVKPITKRQMLAFLRSGKDIEWLYCWLDDTLHGEKAVRLKSLKHYKDTLLVEGYSHYEAFQKELAAIEELKADKITEYQASKLLQWIISLYFRSIP